tara:strand:- start:395 stop:1063 length:669 start_codon:yes stop_codon:yes gene_type:complete
MVKWSYSSINLFKQCPKKYYHLRVAKDIKEKESEALLYGSRVHTAAEEYVRDGTPIPKAFSYIKPAIDAVLASNKGEAHCELRLGLTENLKPCKFFAKDVWYRGVIDLLILDKKNKKAVMVDYKTGKNPKYADTKQLEIMSLAVFKHYEWVETIKAGLLFLVNPALIKANYVSSDQKKLWIDWIADVTDLASCIENEVWNEKPNFTCRGWCPVLDCTHNGKN